MESNATVTDDLYKEKFPEVGAIIKAKTKQTCSTKTLTNRLPVLSWLPRYTMKYVVQDFVAGVTVGLTVIPQGIAYGVVAGLPPQYGLYSGFMGCFMYILFGSCKDVTVGPTAIMALMVQQHVKSSPDYAILSTFLSGCIIFLMGILNLGVLVQFISVPVVTGFTSAAAITIGSGQINSLFGIPSSSNDFITSWKTFFTHITNAKLNDSLLGVLTLIFLLAFRKLKDCRYPNKTVTKYTSLSRNALAVIIGTLLAYLLTTDDYQPFRLTGAIEPGLPKFKPPPFHTTVDDEELSFTDMLNNLGSSVFSIPLIAILETVAIAKAFSKGKPVNATQEMIAVGICNILGSFVQSIPVTGSFTRTAVNNASGVRTPLGGMYTGVIVLMALAFLTGTFYFIPKASLSAIIIAAMIFMVDVGRIAEIWKAKKIDIVPFVVTLLACLFMGLDYGMLVGIGLNLLFILYGSARPSVDITREKLPEMEIALVHIHDDLRYASAEYVKEKILQFVDQNNDVKLVVLKGEEVAAIDSTVGLNLITMKDDLSAYGCDLLYWNWKASTAGVLYRLDPKLKSKFVNATTFEEAVKQHIVPNDNRESIEFSFHV